MQAVLSGAAIGVPAGVAGSAQASASSAVAPSAYHGFQIIRRIGAQSKVKIKGIEYII